ncbi:hypothetical protein B1748_27815 [Paenibacillus sp. MY03]|uniref:FAD-dependent oxidoreductase n=1 Tax=Paenibacillus sp. MY03 TaxID=302980 RepID=UPI000B3C291E|nr:FAD-dependent oxidoreductase [Paenibacillus sp. MY03]OUS70797.1 hypothetical protein B1748_27815 [Paenibacillus sp. MY03]
MKQAENSSIADEAVYGEYDVIVSGGGLIGLVCATAMARTGQRVALVERRNALGWEIGRARRMFVERDQEHAASPYVREFLNHMDDRPGQKKGFHAPFAELIFDRWAMEAKVDVLFHSWAARIAEESGQVVGLYIGTREGYRLLKAPLVIETDEPGRLIDTDYIRRQISQPVVRSLLLGGVALNEMKEMLLPAGNRAILRPLSSNQSRADIELKADATVNANHDYFAMIDQVIGHIREQVDGAADAKVIYLAEEAWRLPEFQLEEGFFEGDAPIGRLLAKEQRAERDAGRDVQSTVELLAGHMICSRSRGLLLAGPWIPCYLAASSDSESRAVLNRFLLGEAVAAFALSHS